LVHTSYAICINLMQFQLLRCDGKLYIVKKGLVHYKDI